MEKQVGRRQAETKQDMQRSHDMSLAFDLFFRNTLIRLTNADPTETRAALQIADQGVREGSNR